MEQQQLKPQAGYPQLPHHISPKGIWVTKVVFRALQIVFDLIIIGLVARVSVAQDRYLPLALLIPPAIVSFIWAIAETICISVRGGHRGIHPGACVGVDLVLWLGITAVAVLFALTGWLWTGGWDDYYSYYDYYSDEYYYDSGVEDAVRIAQAAFAFTILLDVAHFVCFVIACVETSRRNTQPTIVYYQPAPGQMPPQNMYGGGYYSMMPPPHAGAGAGDQPQMGYPPQVYQPGGAYKPFDPSQHDPQSTGSPRGATSEVSAPTPRQGQELPVVSGQENTPGGH